VIGIFLVFMLLPTATLADLLAWLRTPGHVQQAVALHPRHRLADRRAALGQPLGNAGSQRNDAFFLELEDRAKVHLGRVDQPVRRQLSLPPGPMLCRKGKRHPV